MSAPYLSLHVERVAYRIERECMGNQCNQVGEQGDTSAHAAPQYRRRSLPETTMRPSCRDPASHDTNQSQTGENRKENEESGRVTFEQAAESG